MSIGLSLRSAFARVAHGALDLRQSFIDGVVKPIFNDVAPTAIQAMAASYKIPMKEGWAKRIAAWMENAHDKIDGGMVGGLRARIDRIGGGPSARLAPT